MDNNNKPRPTQATETASAPQVVLQKLVEWDERYPRNQYRIVEYGAVQASEKELDAICEEAHKILAAPSVAGPQATPTLLVMQQEIDELRSSDQPHDLDWDKVHSLLEPWQEVWKGDKGKFAAKYPEWMLNAAAELFAHDICDVWSWNDYVAAAHGNN